MKGNQIWSEQEDQYMKRLVSGEVCHANWTLVAQKINLEFSNKMRSPKQCRERFVNHVSMNSNHHSVNDWTEQQTKTLFDLFQKWGSRWTKISQQIQGKSENCVKNRFYGSLRKALRKMNRASKSLVKKFKKEVKYQSITRIIDAAQGLFRLQSPLKERSEELSKKILSLAMKNQQEMPCYEAQQLIIEINKFNMSTRSYKSKKKIKNQGPDNKSTQKESRRQKKEEKTVETKSQTIQSIQEQEMGEHINYIDHENNENGMFRSDNGKQEQKVESGQMNFYQEQNILGGCQNNFTFDLDDLLCQMLEPLNLQVWI